MPTPSQEYRDYLRGVRMFLTPEHEALLAGVPVSNLVMPDLEALFELVFEVNARQRAPQGYQPKH